VNDIVDVTSFYDLNSILTILIQVRKNGGKDGYVRVL